MSTIDFSPSQIQFNLKRILPRVQKPGRYAGGELNQVVKDWETTATKVALAFPDIYDIAIPNLGLSILYEIINNQSDCLAERTYVPWTDMEEQMRAIQLPLYAVESKHPVKEFDILAISLPYETLFTNLLNMLDLAQIPIWSKDRTVESPLVIAGGHATFNPEPMYGFIDAFIIGEGEDVILDVIHCHKKWKAANDTRQNLLISLAQIEGVYVPALYEAKYHEDGTFSQLVKLNPAVPSKVTKRITPVLPPPPTRLVVPNVEVVHDRYAIEIMRGCTRGCRFCHAGMITRPVRERSIETILNAIDVAVDSTGHEEVALLSLSSSDYTKITELVEAISTRFEGRHLRISLPSLRIESFSVDLMDKLKDTRSTGFTLAPEAATERMRKIINKPVSRDQLMETARAIYSRGWTSIKLYFMIGHPEETIEDVQAIIDLCWDVLKLGRSIIGGKAKVHAGVGTFVPKPHTPFQWAACDPEETVEIKQDLLKKSLRHQNIKLSWTDPRETQLEAWLARGDRRMADVIFNAWKMGAKFDAWQDYYRFDLWLEAFEKFGLDPKFYSQRERPLDEVFPWDHISTAIRADYLQTEYKWSKKGRLRDDCRDQCFACGIMPGLSRQHEEDWFCPAPAKTQEEKGLV